MPQTWHFQHNVKESFVDQYKRRSRWVWGSFFILSFLLWLYCQDHRCMPLREQLYILSRCNTIFRIALLLLSPLWSQLESKSSTLCNKAAEMMQGICCFWGKVRISWIGRSAVMWQTAFSTVKGIKMHSCSSQFCNADKEQSCIIKITQENHLLEAFSWRM